MFVGWACLVTTTHSHFSCFAADEDCAGDLVCFERDPGDAVPSCSGGEESDSNTDYCIDPNWDADQGSPAPSASPVAEEPTDAPTSPPIVPPTASPTTATPSAGETTPSPTDPVTTNPPTDTPTTPEPTASPTTAAPSPAVPTSAGLPEVMAVSGSYCTPTAQCPACYGDCDEDSDCQGDLVCEQRDGGEMVTGCSGGEDSPSGEYEYTFIMQAMFVFSYRVLILFLPFLYRIDTDYCVDPNAGAGGRSPATSAPQAAATPPPPPSPTGVLSYSDSCSPTSPCSKCVGDCDADSDCSGSLICPDRNGGEPVPGCSGSDASRKL